MSSATIAAIATTAADPEMEAAPSIAQGLAEELDRDMNLADFVRAAWEVLEPDTEFIDGWHIDYLCAKLEKVADTIDNECEVPKEEQLKRLVINWPPRNTKSIIVSVCFPAWLWGPRKMPSLSLVSTTHAHTLSKKHSEDRRTLIESDWYQARWGHQFSLSDTQNEKTDFENTKRGRMLATSVGGATTGRGGKLLISDDLLDPEQAESDAHRDRALKWFKKVFLTRLDDKKNGAIVVIEQRTHHRDLTGMLKDQGGWEHISIPAIQSKAVDITFPNGFKLHRSASDILSPGREGQIELDQMRVAMGSRAYGAQYQQDPTPESGNYVKVAWWKYWTVLPKDIELRIMSWDTAWEEGQENDYSVCSVWRRCADGFYKEKQIRRRMESPEVIRSIEEEYKRENAIAKVHAVLIEKKASGIAAVQNLKRLKRIPIIAVTPFKSKVLRVNEVAPTIESGKVYLPVKADWVDDYKERFAKFPDVDFDDEMDADTQALTYLDTKRKIVLSRRRK